MEDLLIVILQFLLEMVLDMLGNVLSWPSPQRVTPEPEGVAGPSLLWFCGGALLGGASLLLVHYTLIHSPALRIANLLLAPLLSAYLSRAVAAKRAESNVCILPRNHFWYSFWFTLGLVGVRFVYAVR